MIKNKKGISPVIATILLVLITIAAVSILYVSVIPMITQKTEKSTKCFDAQQSISVVTSQGYTCYNSTATKVQIRRGTGNENITRLQISLSKSDGSSNSTYISSSDIVGINENKVYTINVGNTTKVEIAPYIKIGNTEEPCETTGAVEIPLCS